MFTTQTASWRSTPPWPGHRKPFIPPQHQIALRKEYIATSETRLLLIPQGGAQSAARFKIVEDTYSRPLKFTVTGKKYSDRSCREFRDSSGLPIFELHEKAVFKHRWSVTLPGSDEAGSVVAKAAPKYSITKGYLDFGMSFENQAAVDSKGQEECQVDLVVERHGLSQAVYDVVYGGRTVAYVGENEEHNKTWPHMNPSLIYRKIQPVLDIVVVAGTDLSLVRFSYMQLDRYCCRLTVEQAAAIGVILSDWAYAAYE